MAQTIDRTKPPETPPIPAFKMPPVHETKLPNGLAVVLVEDPRFPAGERAPELSGRLEVRSRKTCRALPSMVAGLLTQGTKTRSYRDLAEELTSIGASLNGNASPDVLTLGGSVLAENTAKLLDLLGGCRTQRQFSGERSAAAQAEPQAGAAGATFAAGFLAQRKVRRAACSAIIPTRYIAPTMESLDRMDQKSMIRFPRRVPGSQ